MIGGPSYLEPDEGGVPCPDCTEAAPRDEGVDRDEAWRDLVLRAWQLLDVECPNDPITEELLAALENTGDRP